MDRDHRIVIVGGCGHVGLPLGIVLAVFGDALDRSDCRRVAFSAVEVAASLSALVFLCL